MATENFFASESRRVPILVQTYQEWSLQIFAPRTLTTKVHRRRSRGGVLVRLGYASHTASPAREANVRKATAAHFFASCTKIRQPRHSMPRLQRCQRLWYFWYQYRRHRFWYLQMSTLNTTKMLMSPSVLPPHAPGRLSGPHSCSGGAS